MPLSPLQQQVAAIVAETTEGREVGLAGGAALIVSGIGDRLTRDLDFFATTAATVDELAPRVLDALRSAGLVVEQVRASPGFTRLQIADGADTTELDLAWDARIRNLRDSEYGPVLARDELAADKMLALYGRAEARDFVDVYRLRSIYPRARLFELAAEKDRGFVADAFAETLKSIGRRDRIEFQCDDATFDAIQSEFADWHADLSGPTFVADPHPPAERRPKPGMELDL